MSDYLHNCDNSHLDLETRPKKFGFSSAKLKSTDSAVLKHQGNNLFLAKGNSNHKLGSTSWLRKTFQSPTVLLRDNLVTNRQPHARAFANGFGTKEGVK